MTAYTLPNLQPQSMGQLLDRAIRLYRKNFLTFIGIVAITQIPTLLFGIVNAVFTGQDSVFDPLAAPSADPFGGLSDQLVGLGLLGVFAALLGVVLTQIANATVTRAVLDDYFGREIGIIEAFGRVKNEWVVLLVALILVGFLSIGVAIFWIIIPCLGWFTGLGMLLFLGAVMIPMITPIVVIEQQKAVTAVLRAWDLTRRRFWWVLGFALLLSIFGLLILGGPTLLLTFGVSAAIGTNLNSTAALIVQQVVQSLINIVYLPLPLICFTLLYLDLRIRTEGLDLALQTASLKEDGNVEAAISSAPPPGKWVPTSEEMLKFFGITVAFLGLYFGFIALVIAIVSVATL